MPESLAPSRTLWLIVAPPIIAVLWQIAKGLTRRSRPAGRGSDAWERRVGVGSVVLASGATLGHALRFARAPAGTAAFVERGIGGIVAGPLDASLGLRFDPLSATACGLACAVAIATAALLAVRPAGKGRGPVWAWLPLALAGGLLSFLADGLAMTFVGWALAAAAAAWLGGWTAARRGAAIATRGALALVALLLGAVMHADPGADARTTGFALVAFLVAAGAMSASAPPLGAPFALAALGCGGTIGLLGPFLLLRLALLAPPSSFSGAGHLIAIAGAVMLAGVGRRALLGSDGTSRWLALAGGAPAGVTCISLGSDGEKGGLLVLVSAGLTAALLLLTAAGRAGPIGLPGTVDRRDLEAELLVRAPEGAGTLLLSFERWVVDSLAGAVVVLLHASAWALSRLDARRP